MEHSLWALSIDSDDPKDARESIKREESGLRKKPSLLDVISSFEWSLRHSTNVAAGRETLFVSGTFGKTCLPELYMFRKILIIAVY